MRDESRLAQERREVEFARLIHDAGLHLRLNRMAPAEETIGKLLDGWPERTTVHELAGDLALAKGQVGKARVEYKRALEIEPANGDAEYKLGLALTTQTPEEVQRDFVNQVIADPSAVRERSPRKPGMAVLNAILFPGLGQLYNQEHEEGVAIVGVGAFLLMMLFYLVVQEPFSTVAQTAHGARRLSLGEQMAQAKETLGGMGAGHWTLIILFAVAYLTLYAWGILDAWRTAQSNDEKKLGIR
jgi:hypothetical protein